MFVIWSMMFSLKLRLPFGWCNFPVHLIWPALADSHTNDWHLLFCVELHPRDFLLQVHWHIHLTSKQKHLSFNFWKPLPIPSMVDYMFMVNVGKYNEIYRSSHGSYGNLEKTPLVVRSPGFSTTKKTSSQVDGCYRKWRPRKGLELILRSTSCSWSHWSPSVA